MRHYTPSVSSISSSHVGTWKIFTAATYGHISIVSKLGVVAVDHWGNTSFTALARLFFAKSVQHAKVGAILLGILMARDRNIDRILMASDSLLAINLLQKGENSTWEGGSILYDRLDTATKMDQCGFPI
ncbi:hypothetical protein DITRI_Ditri15bG0087300 [Diplodiscus trichospermus]